MKKTILFLLLVGSIQSLLAQNYLTQIPFPDTSSFLPLRTRNFIKTDQQNNIWIGFGGEKIGSNGYIVSPLGLAKYGNGAWSSYNTSNSNIATNDITSIDFQGNTTWIGSNAGLVKFNNNQFTVYNTKNSGIVADTVVSVSVSGNIIWLATNNGISKFDGNTFTNFTTSNSNLASNSTTSILGTSNSSAYIGTKNGLSYLQGSTFTTFNKNNSGMLSNLISTLHLDKNNTLWIAADSSIKNGIIVTCLHYLKNGTIRNLLDNNLNTNDCSYELPQTCRSIVSDDLGNVYFTNSDPSTTNRELKIHKLLDNTIQLYAPKNSEMTYLYKNGLIALDNKKRIIIFNSSYKGRVTSVNIINLDSLNKRFIEGEARYLDINQISSPYSAQSGLMNWDIENSKNYEMPKGSCKKTIFVSGLWIGGLANGKLHLAAQTYRQQGTDFYAGPIDTVLAAKPNPESQNQTPNEFAKTWKINRFDIEALKINHANGNIANGSYKIPLDISTWPAKGTGNFSRNLAPFFDNDKDGIYNPVKGDYPIIKGDQMVYWILNDNAYHGETNGSTQMGIEVHGSAYAYVCNNFADNNDSSILNYTTFTELNIINKSSKKYDSARIGIFIDHDIGNYEDDFVGCNPKVGYSYAYNGDDIDEKGYGINPPVSSTLFLKTPENNNKQVGFGKFASYGNDNTVQGNPSIAKNYWNYLNGIWKDNTPITYGGIGKGGTDTASFMYCGKDDLAGRPYWDELTAGNTLGDRRCLNATNMFTFNAGETKTITYATVNTRANRSNWRTKMEADIALVKSWYNKGIYPSCLKLNIGINGEKNESNLPSFKIYPNPCNGKFTIDFNTNNGQKIITVFDIQGKVIRSMMTEKIEVNIDLAEYSKGLYLVNIQTEKGIVNSKIIIE